MFRVPKYLDIKNIIGCQLNLLGLGACDVQLNFDGSGIKICIQGIINLIENDKLIASWGEDSAWSSLDFQKILNATVIGYDIPNDKLLQIIFENNLILQLHDDSEQYEAIQIYFDDPTKSIIIV
jgi:hypothetical protein